MNIKHMVMAPTWTKITKTFLAVHTFTSLTLIDN